MRISDWSSDVCSSDRHTGPALPLHLRAGASNPDAQATRPFTSAKLVTRKLAAWNHGRIEIRARLPQGPGTWPALWMRSEERRVGKESVSTCRSRVQPYP